LFYRLLDIHENTKVLDLGGGSYFWRLAIELGLAIPKVTILNIRRQEEELPANVKWVVGDARASGFANGAFDVVFCNSLIEHLGDRDAQVRLAYEVRRLAGGYFVQTPDWRFPVEPHYVTPFVHWFPKQVRSSMIRNFTIWGLLNRPSPARCRELADEIRLLSPTEMRELFPDGDVLVERFAGIPKSLIAVRTCSNPRAMPQRKSA
jgi:SAM-dependent methyltransferase